MWNLGLDPLQYLMLWFPVWAGGELGYTEKSLFNSLWGQSTPWSCGPVASAVNTYGYRTLSKRRGKKKRSKACNAEGLDTGRSQMPGASLQWASLDSAACEHLKMYTCPMDYWPLGNSTGRCLPEPPTYSFCRPTGQSGNESKGTSKVIIIIAS